MGFKKYGKLINTDKLQKGNALKSYPSNQASALGLPLLKDIQKFTDSIKDPKRYSEWFLPTFPTDNTFTASETRTEPRNYTEDLANPFYNYLMKNSVTRISTTLKSATTGTTTLSVIAPGSDYMIRAKDTFYLYNRKTFNSMQLTATEDLMSSQTSITIGSTNFKRSDYYPAGSFIVADNRVLMQRAANAIEYKYFRLSNAAYKLLLTSPYTLLAADPGYLHMPISCYINYVHGADELTNTDLYIGHNSGSTTAGDYWGSLGSAFYRDRNSLLFQIGASTYGAGVEADYNDIPQKSSGDNGTGDALTLYTAHNFVSASSYIELHLYYKSIKMA